MQVDSGQEAHTSRLTIHSLQSGATCACECCNVSPGSSELVGSSRKSSGEADVTRSQTPMPAITPLWQAADAKHSVMPHPVASARQSLEVSIDGAYGSYQLIPGLSMDTLVGTGAYATVYKGTWLGQQVAVKVGPLEQCKDCITCTLS